MKLLIYSNQNCQITRSGKPMFILKIFFNTFYPFLKSIHLSLYLITSSPTFMLGEKTHQLLGKICWCIFFSIIAHHVHITMGKSPFSLEKNVRELVMWKHIKYNSALHCSLQENVCVFDVLGKTKPVKGHSN